MGTTMWKMEQNLKYTVVFWATSNHTLQIFFLQYLQKDRSVGLW